MAYPHICALLLTVSTTKPASDQWFGITLAGHPSGSFHQRIEARAGGGLRSVDDMRLAIGRLGGRIEVTTHVVTDEGTDGQFISCKSVSTFAKTVISSLAQRRGDTIEISGDSGGKHYLRAVSCGGSLLGPRAVERLRATKLAEVGDKASYPVFDALVGRTTQENYVVSHLSEHGGRVIEDRLGSEAGVTLNTIDKLGHTVRQEQDLPFGKMVMILASERAAKAFARNGDMPADMFDRTIARSNVDLPDPRSIEKIKLEITTSRPDLGLPDLTTANQTVLYRDRKKVILEVTRTADAKPVNAQVEEEATKPNELVQSDDPGILGVKNSLRRPGETPSQIARSDQDWLSERVKLGAGISIASASETLKSQRGTCVAFAILLAALERASNIPSRVLQGLVYEEGMWGAHAWTEAFVDGKWVAYDAALPSRGPVDAARFSFGCSSLAEGPGGLLGGAVQIYGNVKVRTLAYTQGGHETVVAAAQPRYRVSHNKYSNPSLHLNVRKTADGRFCDLDCVYPNSTILAIRYPAAVVRVQLTSEVPNADGGNRRTLSVENGSVSKTWTVGQSRWTVTASGKSARKRLKYTLDHFELK